MVVLHTLLFCLGLISTSLTYSGQSNTVIASSSTKLSRYISSAQADKFKVAYTVSVFSQETINQLLESAKKNRTDLEKKIAALRSETNPQLLLTGIAQSGVGLLALLNTCRACLACYKVYQTKWGYDLVEKPHYLLFGKTLPFYFVKNDTHAFPGGTLLLMCEPTLNQQKTRFVAGATASIVGLGLISAIALSSGYANIQHGLLYKTYLASQIKNLDEIILCLENSLALHKEEQKCNAS